VSGTLYIVATPIGNLEDLSPRARRILADVALIAAEDTRHTGRLLSHIGVQTPLKAVHEHNESAIVDSIIAVLSDGASVALVSDAGTPLVSDPGYRLVAAARARGIEVSPIPGPSAVMAAISAAGLPTDRFCFEGFLPAKSKARVDVLRSLAHETRTLVFYESVHRIAGMLADLTRVFGAGRRAFIGRELTKLHEQTVAGTLADICDRLERGEIPQKGEFVVVVSGGEAAGAHAIADDLARELAAVLPVRQAATIVAKVTGARRNEVYQKLLDAKK
jgi:16S rRNA (cytidine1402-2'-O)-methyltransferase